jgi:cell division septum initiation protein DivIVA
MKNYVGECKGNDGGGCFLDSCGHDCGCFTVEESKKQQKYDEMLAMLKEFEIMCDKLQFPTETNLREMRNKARNLIKEAKEL